MKKKYLPIIVSFIIGCSIVIFSLWCDKILVSKELKLIKLINESFIDILLAQISLTFITISVMSILSDSTVVIYWKNIVTDKLIEPLMSCFSAFTIYAYMTVAFSIVATIINNKILLAIMFLVDIIILGRLSLIMIDVYYDREKKKEKLNKYFRKEYLLNKDGEEIKKIKEKLLQNTLNAFNNHNYEVFKENCEFYKENARCFNIGEIKWCLGYINTYTFEMIIELLFAYLEKGLYIVDIYKSDIYENMLKNIWKTIISDESKEYAMENPYRLQWYQKGICLYGKILLIRLFEYNYDYKKNKINKDKSSYNEEFLYTECYMKDENSLVEYYNNYGSVFPIVEEICTSILNVLEYYMKACELEIIRYFSEYYYEFPIFKYVLNKSDMEFFFSYDHSSLKLIEQGCHLKDEVQKMFYIINKESCRKTKYGDRE